MPRAPRPSLLAFAMLRWGECALGVGRGGWTQGDFSFPQAQIAYRRIDTLPMRIESGVNAPRRNSEKSQSL